MKIPPPLSLHSEGRKRSFLSAPGTLPPWALILFALVVGLLTYQGIERVNMRHRRASQAEVIVAQTQTLALDAENIYLRFLIDPTQTATLSAEYQATLVQVLDHLGELKKVGPGPEYEKLQEKVDLLLAAAQQDPSLDLPESERTPDMVYLNTVLLPLANEFFTALDQAQVEYHDVAKIQERWSKIASALVLLMSSLMISGLFVINERIRRNNSAFVERQEMRFRALVQHGTDLISLIDQFGRIQFQSPSIRTLLGRDPRSVVSQPLVSLVHPEDVPIYIEALRTSGEDPLQTVTVELRLLHDDGTWRTVESVISNLTHNRAVNGYVMTSRDVTLRNEFTEHVAHAATHDQLTALPNRRLLLDRLEHSLERANRSGDSLSIIFTDLDGFKFVNDTYGHDVGDELLRQVSSRIRNSIRPGDTLARLGGDEFVILLESSGAETAMEVAGRLKQTVSAPYLLLEHSVSISLSMGISERGGPFDLPEELLREADTAMYVCKRRRDGQPVVFDPSMTEHEPQSITAVDSAPFAAVG